MTTLFYPGSVPTVSRVGLAYYGESLAAHSFFFLSSDSDKKYKS